MPLRLALQVRTYSERNWKNPVCAELIQERKDKVGRATRDASKHNWLLDGNPARLKWKRWCFLKVRRLLADLKLDDEAEVAQKGRTQGYQLCSDLERRFARRTFHRISRRPVSPLWLSDALRPRSFEKETEKWSNLHQEEIEARGVWRLGTLLERHLEPHEV